MFFMFLQEENKKKTFGNIAYHEMCVVCFFYLYLSLSPICWAL